MTAARTWHALVAVLGITGLAIELHFTFEIVRGPPTQVLVTYFSFFTILGNLLVTAMAAGFVGGWRIATAPAMRAATTLYIVVVAAVFQLLLAAIVRPTGIDWWGNMLAHRLVPAAWTIGWLASGRHGGIRRMTPLLWLIYPALYGGWTLAHGAATGWYPYAFLSVARIGIGRVLANMAAMALVFLLLGYAIRWIDGRLAVRRAPG